MSPTPLHHPMDNSINPEKDGRRKAQQMPRTGLLSCYLANGPTYLRNNHNFVRWECASHCSGPLSCPYLMTSDVKTRLVILTFFIPAQSENPCSPTPQNNHFPKWVIVMRTRPYKIWNCFVGVEYFTRGTRRWLVAIPTNGVRTCELGWQSIYLFYAVGGR